MNSTYLGSYPTGQALDCSKFFGSEAKTLTATVISLLSTLGAEMTVLVFASLI